MCSGIISSVLTFSHFASDFHNPDSNLTGAIVSTFTGTCPSQLSNGRLVFTEMLNTTGGAFFGAALAGWMNDKFGRERSIQVRFRFNRQYFIVIILFCLTYRLEVSSLCGDVPCRLAPITSQRCLSEELSGDSQ